MITLKFRCSVIVVLFILTTLVSPIFSASVPFSAPRKGKIDGVTLWTLPRTNNGLQPIQSWHNAGSSPDGDIYVSGMDHLTNAALYCVHNNTLRYVGDAKSASQAANNWKTDEYAQKFHTRAAYLNGRMYVAVLNRSYFNAELYATMLRRINSPISAVRRPLRNNTFTSTVSCGSIPEADFTSPEEVGRSPTLPMYSSMFITMIR